MPGFASYDQVINALSVNAKGESVEFGKPSITTVAGGKYSLAYAAGLTPAYTFGTALTATQMTSAVTGAIFPFTDPTSPNFKHLLVPGIGSTVAAGAFLVHDVLARYPLNGTVLSGTFTTVTLPARDNNGASAGVGVQAMVINASATASTATTLTLNYTNSAGVAGRTTGAVAIIAAAQHRALHDANGFFMPLQAGDVGIQSIQSYTLGATATSTQIEIQLVRPLVRLPVLVAGGYVERNMAMESPRLPRLYPGTALSIGLAAATTTSGIVNGNLQYAEN